MNLEQLENILRGIEIIETLIEEDTEGSRVINETLDKFREAVKSDLKNLVWVRYLGERG